MRPVSVPDDRDVRVGVVGYGYWGSKHVRVLRSIAGVDVTVIDRSAQRLAEARRAFPGVETGSELDQVLDRLDAVVVATAPGAHGPLALAALRAGRHVLVEKPMATSVADAELLVDQAATSRTTLMVGHTFEYNAAVRMLKEIVDSGALGRILCIDSARLSLGRHQQDVNVVWDLAPHDISIVSYLLGEMPRAASVWTQRNVGAHADVAYLRLEFDRSQVSAFVHVSWLNPHKVRRTTVVGEKKMAVYDDMSEERIRLYDVGADPADHRADGAVHAMPVTYRTGDITSPHVPFSEPLLVQDGHFIDCIRTGHAPATPGQRGLDVVRVLAATDEAQLAGGSSPVPVPRQAPVPWDAGDLTTSVQP